MLSDITPGKIRNKFINYADSFVPLGYKLGDFSSYLVVDDRNTRNISDVSTIKVHSNFSTAPQIRNKHSNGSLSSKVMSKVVDSRRNQAISEYQREMKLHNKEYEVDYDSDMDSSTTTIEFTLPHSRPSSSGSETTTSIPISSTLLDTDLLSNGLSLLNLSLNSEIVTNNPSNSKRFMGEAISRIVDSVKDEETMTNIFKSFDDSTKFAIMKFYLSDNELVYRLQNGNLYNENKFSSELLNEKRKARHDSEGAFKVFTNQAKTRVRNKQKTKNRNRLETKLEELILMSFKLWTVLITLAYFKILVPIFNAFWYHILELNERYQLIEISVRVAVNILFNFVSFFLKLILILTKKVNVEKIDRNVDIEEDDIGIQSTRYSREVLEDDEAERTSELVASMMKRIMSRYLGQDIK